MRPQLVGEQDAGADPMRDDQEGEIGRRVVGALGTQSSPQILQALTTLR